MRSLLLAAALLVPSLCSAQVYGLPLGTSAYPMIYFDEYSSEPPETVAFPDSAWSEALSCSAGLGVDTAGIARPRLAVLPYIRTFRVTDMTKDSLLQAEQDTTDLGRFQTPTIAYALVHTNVVLATEMAARRHSTLRHEALHFILWRSRKIYGHPWEYFGPCDTLLHQ